MPRFRCACCGRELSRELILEQYYPKQWIGNRARYVCRDRVDCAEVMTYQEPKMSVVERHQRRFAG